jgi:hypothetical protein
MGNTIRTTGLAVAAVLVLGSAAKAQAPGQYRPGSSPAYSPYLNLLRPGNPATNYYGLVRPQIDTANSINALQQQYNSLRSDINAPIEQVMAPPTTGHGAVFMSYSRYFPGIQTGRTGVQPRGTGTAMTGGTPAAGNRR